MQKTILLIDDDDGFRRSIYLFLKDTYIVTECASGYEARDCLKNTQFDLILLDITMPDVDGITLLKEIKATHSLAEIVMLTAVTDVQTAIHASKLGAFDYLTKPIDLDHLGLVIERAFERSMLREKVLALSHTSHPHIVGESAVICQIHRDIEKIAKTNVSVLITGESGTGKEVFAKEIHLKSHRKDAPFIIVNTPTLPANMFEAELFGYMRGAFTGAMNDKMGKFELADGGTIFLDEIGEIPLDVQSKLLRVLQEGTLERLGGNTTKSVDVRVIAATNIPIQTAIQENRFRLDLYHRLSGIEVKLPALRDRMGDIPLLATYFLDQFCKKYQKPRLTFDPLSLEILNRYTFPGNIRELIHIIERLVVLSDGPVILPSDLPIQ